MGACYSCRSSSSSSSSSSKPKSDKFNTVKVVHLGGYVEEFDQPVPVSQVAMKPEKEFVCTPLQLLSGGTNVMMTPEAALEPGRVYFLLPYSVLHADMSPIDLAALARKLSAIAKAKQPSPAPSPGLIRTGSQSPGWASPARSPSRVWDGPMTASFGAQRSVRAHPWKPILDPIREKSFHRRNESELNLQDTSFDDSKD